MGLQEKPKEEILCITLTNKKLDLVRMKLRGAIEQKCVLIWLITCVFEHSLNSVFQNSVMGWVNSYCKFRISIGKLG